MEKHKKCAESLMRLGDEILLERKRRRTLLMRSFTVCVGAAAVLGIGLSTFALRPPKKPAPCQSGIIIETETYLSETTATQASPSTTAAKPTTAKQTTAANHMTTTAVSTAATASPPRQTTATVHTTTFAEKATTTAVDTTAAVTASSDVQTTAAITTAAYIVTNEMSSVSTEHIPWKRVAFGEKKIYRVCSLENEQITAAAENIGEYYGEGTLMIDDEQSTCKLYTYKNFSPTYVCAVKETEDSEPKLYSSAPKFDTLGELLEATDFENTVVIKAAYKGFKEPNSVSLEMAPTMSDLMKVLSDTSLEPIDTSFMNTRSYTLEVEIPELGIEHSHISILRLPGASTGLISLNVFGNKCTYNIGAKKLADFIRTFDESYSPEIKFNI